MLFRIGGFVFSDVLVTLVTCCSWLATTPIVAVSTSIDLAGREGFSRIASDRTFLDRIGVVVVALALREQEQVFVALSWPIRHALGHRIWLAPDDVAAEIPAIGLQGECHTPRDAD